MNQKRLIQKAANDLGDALQADVVIIYTMSTKEGRIRMGCCGSNEKYAEIAGVLQDAGFEGMDITMQHIAAGVDEP